MAQVIEFYIPSRFKKKVKWISTERRGKVLEFPVEVKENRLSGRHQLRIMKPGSQRMRRRAYAPGAYTFNDLAPSVRAFSLHSGSWCVAGKRRRVPRP